MSGDTDLNVCWIVPLMSCCALVLFIVLHYLPHYCGYSDADITIISSSHSSELSHLYTWGYGKTIICKDMTAALEVQMSVCLSCTFATTALKLKTSKGLLKDF